jgi:hypothetical protein
MVPVCQTRTNYQVCLQVTLTYIQILEALEHHHIYHVDTLAQIIYYIMLAVEVRSMSWFNVNPFQIVFIYGFYQLAKSGAIDKQLSKYASWATGDAPLEGLDTGDEPPEVSVRSHIQTNSDLREVSLHKTEE